MKTVTSRSSTIELGHDQLMAFDAAPGERVRVLCGGGWLTQEGERGDTFLRSGDELRLRGGRTLLGALEPTRLQRLGDARPAGMLRRLAQALRRWATRMQLGPVQPEPVA